MANLKQVLSYLILAFSSFKLLIMIFKGFEYLDVLRMNNTRFE